MVEDADAPEEVMWQGDWITAKRRGKWEYVARARGIRAAVILPLDGDHVILVEQYRVPVGARVLELPAGLIGDEAGAEGEDPLDAARRELVEETGWQPGSVEVLLVGPTSAGMSNERIAFVRARNLKKVGDGGGVDNEDIVVHAVPRKQAPAWLMRKHAEGFELDLKLWAGLWMIERNPDGSPVD